VKNYTEDWNLWRKRTNTISYIWRKQHGNVSRANIGLLVHVCHKMSIPKFTILTHTRLTALCPGLPRWAGTRKATPIWIFLKQETVSGSGISWAICKSAPRSRQITMPAPHYSFFYRPDTLPATQPTASKHWRQLVHNTKCKLETCKFKVQNWVHYDERKRIFTIFKKIFSDGYNSWIFTNLETVGHKFSVDACHRTCKVGGFNNGCKRSCLVVDDKEENFCCLHRWHNSKSL